MMNDAKRVQRMIMKIVKENRDNLHLVEGNLGKVIVLSDNDQFIQQIEQYVAEVNVQEDSKLIEEEVSLDQEQREEDIKVIEEEIKESAVEEELFPSDESKQEDVEEQIEEDSIVLSYTIRQVNQDSNSKTQ